MPARDDAAETRIAVALFDDHVLMRESLARALSRDPGLQVVATGGSAEEAVAAALEHVPDVILLDLNMPGRGISAALRLARLSPASRVIVLTSDDAAHQIDAALSAGACAFLIKGASTTDIRAAIRRACSGKSEMSPSLAARLLNSRPLAAPWGAEGPELPFELLEREEQILRRLSQGLNPAEIGESIGLSETTVEAFISNIMIKIHGATASGGIEEPQSF